MFAHVKRNFAFCDSGAGVGAILQALCHPVPGTDQADSTKHQQHDAGERQEKKQDLGIPRKHLVDNSIEKIHDIRSQLNAEVHHAPHDEVADHHPHKRRRKIRDE